MPRRLTFVAVLFAAACSWTWRSFPAVQKSCVLAVKTGGQRSPAEVVHAASQTPKAKCKQTEHVELFFVRQGVHEKATVHGKQMVDILAGDLLSAGADGDAAAPPGATPAPLLMKRMFLLQKVGQTYEYASKGRNKGSRYLWRAVVLRGAVGGEGQRQAGAAPGPGASIAACYTVTLWFLTSVHTAHDAYESALNARVPEAEWRKKIQADELETEIKEAIAEGRRGGLRTGVEDEDLDLEPHRRDPFVLATLAAMAGCRGGGATHDDQMLTKMDDRDFRSRLVQGARVRDAIARAVAVHGHTSLPLLLRGRRETNEQSFELGAKRFMDMVNASGAPAGAPQSVLDPFFERQRTWFQRQGFRNRFGILANGKMVESDATFADAVKRNKLVFLTGLAGTGKSTELLWQTLGNWKKVFVIARQKGLQTELRRQVAAQDVTAGSTSAGELAKRISFDAIDPVASKSESDPESHRMEKPYFQERQDDFLHILSKKKTLRESCSVEKRGNASSDGTPPKGKGGKARGKAVAQQGGQKTSRALVYEWYEEEWGSPATYDVFRFFAAICQKFWVGRAGREEDGDYEEDHLARPLPSDECRQRLLDMANRSTNHFLPQLRESTARAMGYEHENYQAKAELQKDGGSPAPSTADLLRPWVECFLAFRTEMPQILLDVAREQAQSGTSTGLERERFRSLEDRTLAGFTSEQLTTWAAAHGLALDAPAASGDEPEEGAWGGQRQHQRDESDDEEAGPTETLLVVDEAQNLSDMELLFYLALAARIEGLRLVFGIDIHQQLATGPRDKIALLTALLSSSMGLRTLPRETQAALDVDIGMPAVHRLTTVWRTPERLLPLVEKLVLWRAKLVGLSLSTSGRGARAAGAGGLAEADGDALGGRGATSSPLLAAPPAEDDVEEVFTSEDDKHKSVAPPLRRRGSLAIVRATSFSDDHVADAIYQQSGRKIEKSKLATTLLPNVVKIVVGSRKELEARRDLSSTVLSVAEVQGLEFGVVLIFLPHLVEQQLQLQLQEKGQKTSSQGAGTRMKKATKQELGDWLAQLFIAFTRANSGIIIVGQNVSPSQQTPVFAEAGKPKHQHHSASIDKFLWGEPFQELLHGAVWPSPSSPTEGPGAAASTDAPPVLHILTEAQDKWETTLFTLLQGAGSPGTSALARELFGKHVLPRWKTTTSAARMRNCERGSAGDDTAIMEVEDVREDTVMEVADEEGPRPSQTAEAHQLTWGVDRVSGKRVTLDDVVQAAARFYSRHRAASRSNSMEVDAEQDIGEEGVEENGAWLAFRLAVAAYEEKSSQAFRAKLPRELGAGGFRSMPSDSEAAVHLQRHILQEVKYFLRAKDIEAVFSMNGGPGRGVPMPNVPQIRGVFSLNELAQLAKVAQRSSLEDLGPQESRGHDGADDDKDSPLEDFGAVAYVLLNLDQFPTDAAFPKFRHLSSSSSYDPPPPAAGAPRGTGAATATGSDYGSGGLPLRLECLYDMHAVFESLGRRLLHRADLILSPVAGMQFSAARGSKPLLQLSHQVRAMFGREYLLPTVLSLPVDREFLLQQIVSVSAKGGKMASADELEQLQSCERSWAQVVAAAGEPWDRFDRKSALTSPGDSAYIIQFASAGLFDSFSLAAVLAKVNFFRAPRADQVAEVASYCKLAREEQMHGAARPSPSSPTEGPGAAASTSAPPVLHNILIEAQDEKWESKLYFTLLQGAGSPGTPAQARELFGKHVLPRWKTSAAQMRTCGGWGSAVDDTAMEVEDSGDTVMEGADEEGPRPSQTAEAHQRTWGVDRVSGKRVTLDDVVQAAARFYSRHRAPSRSNSMDEVEDFTSMLLLQVDVEQDIGEEGVEENGAWLAFQLAVAAYEEKSSQAFRANLPRELQAGDVFRSMPSDSEAAVRVFQRGILQEVKYFLRANAIEDVFPMNVESGRRGAPMPNVPPYWVDHHHHHRAVFSLNELAQLAEVAQRFSSLEDLGPQESRGHGGADEDKDSPLKDFGAVAYVLLNLDQLQFPRDADFPEFRHLFSSSSYDPLSPGAVRSQTTARGGSRQKRRTRQRGNGKRVAQRGTGAAIATGSGSGSGGLPLRFECLYDMHAVFESLARRLLHRADLILSPVAGMQSSAARGSTPLLQLSHQVRAIFGHEYLLPTVLSLPVDRQLLQQMASVSAMGRQVAFADEFEQLESCERSWAQVVAAAGEPWDRFDGMPALTGTAPGHNSDYLLQFASAGLFESFSLAAVLAKVSFFLAPRPNQVAELTDFTRYVVEFNQRKSDNKERPLLPRLHFDLYKIFNECVEKDPLFDKEKRIFMTKMIKDHQKMLQKR